MIRVSSNLTLFFKLIIPLVWVIFYGSFSIGLLFLSNDKLLSVGPIWIKYVIWGVFVTGLLIMYFTIFKLKRVELSDTLVYISNYQRGYYYDYRDLASFSEKNYGLFKTGHITFKEATSFGKGIYFLIAESKYSKFIKENTNLFMSFRDKNPGE